MFFLFDSLFFSSLGLYLIPVELGGGTLRGKGISEIDIGAKADTTRIQ
jgi:hypothetical protein